MILDGCQLLGVVAAMIRYTAGVDLVMEKTGSGYLTLSFPELLFPSQHKRGRKRRNWTLARQAYWRRPAGYQPHHQGGEDQLERLSRTIRAAALRPELKAVRWSRPNSYAVIRRPSTSWTTLCDQVFRLRLTRR